MAGVLLGNDGLDRKRVLPIGARHGRNRPVEVDANLGNDCETLAHTPPVYNRLVPIRIVRGHFVL